MKLILGTSQTGDVFSATLPPSQPWNLFDDAAAERLIHGDELRVDWSLALWLLELAATDRLQVNAGELPTWLSPDDVHLLADALEAVVPRLTPLQLYVADSASTTSPNFGFKTRWETRAGHLLHTPPLVRGGLVQLPESGWRHMTTAQFEVLQIAEHHVAGDRESNLRATGRLLSAARRSPGVRLSSNLAALRIQEVEAITPRLRPTGGTYDVDPTHDGVPPDVLDAYFRGTPASKLGDAPVSWRSPTGEQHRAVFSERGRAGIRAIRSRPRLTGDDAAEAVTAPERFFDPVLDLTGLSDRVIGLGPKVDRPVPILREIPAQSWWDWDATAVLSPLDAEDAEAPPLDLKSNESRAALKSAIERADARGSAYIPHPTSPGRLVEVTGPLREALDAADTVEEAHRKTPAKRPPMEVLLVFDNFEQTNYGRAATLANRTFLPVERPVGLRSSVALETHQKEGVGWLLSLAPGPDGAGVGGALLADDMGLGKTLQVLSLLSERLEAGRGPFLVVAPVTLLDNWEREAEKFFGDRFEPMWVVRGADLRGPTQRDAQRLQSQPLVLASYDTIRLNELTFAQVDFDVVVLDEAQRAKNPGTQTARVVRTLKAKFRLAMTGTPVENTLSELWAIYDWVAPGLLGSLREFHQSVVKPVSQGDSSTRAAIAQQLRDTIGPRYLRRMKKDVLSDKLPRIHDLERIEVALSPEQLSAYGALIDSINGGPAEARVGGLIRLFGICAHPDLAGSDELEPLDKRPFEKGERLFRLLRTIAGRGEKALVFANRHRVQRWIQAECERNFDFQPYVINGEITGSTKRLALIEDFSNRPGFNVLVLAPRAAGVGLNITAANHVIHYTREWNPAVENQATDRAYRLGQTRPVHVYTLVAKAPAFYTVEERLDQLLEQKRRLMTDFVVPLGLTEITPDDLLSN